MYRFLPYSPGIAWRTKNDIIVPKITARDWECVQQRLNTTVVAHGGLIESFMSLAYLEMLNYHLPKTELFWCGNDEFTKLIEWQGLAKVSNVIDCHIIKNYPVPIFMDSGVGSYFNCLNNYLKIHTCLGKFVTKSTEPIMKQLWNNSTQKWNTLYTPKFRNLEHSSEFIRWAKVVNFPIKAPYVCIIAEQTKLSQHNCSMLKLEETQIKAVGAVLKQQGINTVVFTHNYGRYYNTSVYTLPPKLDYFMYLIPNAKAILSEDIDILLVSILMSKAKIVCRKPRKIFGIFNNINAMKIKYSDIYVGEKKLLNPNKIIKFIVEGRG